MAVPFRRTSKTAKRKRRTHFKIEAPAANTCPSCGKMRLNHRVCRHCGNYDNKSIIGAA